MSEFSFGKQYRLLSSDDFDYLKSGCQQINTKFVKAYFKPTRKNKEHSRIGISVSKKVGKAKTRNKFKREIRETFRKSILREKALDVLFVVSPRLTSYFPSDSEAKAEFKKSFYGLLQKVDQVIK